MGPKRFTVGCELQYQVTTPTTFVWNVAVRPGASQKIESESLTLTPALPVVEVANPNRLHRILAQPGPLTLRYEATVATFPTFADPLATSETPIADLPCEVLDYLLPSRYCQSDKLGRFAESEFGKQPPGHTRVQAICNWIYQHVEYLRGSSDAHTSAVDTVAERAGVCRDFAHLSIALCRALNIPARFVSAYAWHLVPPDFHAVFEAYVGGAWYLFDATRQVPLTGIVRIGTGRDAVDASFGTFYGAATMNQMSITMESLSGDPENTDQAVLLG